MPINFPIPERCLLVQAAHWFIDRTRVPLPDNIYRRAPVELKADNSELRDLFLALQAEDCKVWGRVVVEFRKYEKGPFDEQPKEVDSSLAWPKLSSKKIEIDKVWLDHIDFSNSKIPFGPVVLGKLKFDTSALDEDTWSKFEFRHQQYPEDEGWQPEFFFGDVTLNFSKLRAFLSSENESTPSPAERRTQQTINQQRLCELWLVDLMKVQGPEFSKDGYFELAKEKFSVSRRGFNTAWSNAVKEAENLDWSKPGRKS